MSDKTPAGEAPVLQQADALMRRHRRFVAGGEVTVNAVAEDVPVLTEVVEQDALSTGVPEQEIAARIHAAVGANEAELARALERWIATQLPHALALALDSVADQLQQELAARLRAELLTRPMFDQGLLPGKPGKPAR